MHLFHLAEILTHCGHISRPRWYLLAEKFFLYLQMKTSCCCKIISLKHTVSVLLVLQL